MDSFLTATAAAALPVFLVWAGAVDIVCRSIPNRLVLSLAACFGLFAMSAGISAAQIATHMACGCAVLICGFLLFSQSMIGGGDAKLFAATALWLGFDSLLPFLAGTALAGGVLALAYLAVGASRGQLPRTIPYGAAIAAGALAVLPDWLATF